MIPSTFTIGGQKFKVIIEDKVMIDNDEVYGDFSYSPPEIHLAKTMDGHPIDQNQIVNTFRHELIHCFQYMFDNSSNEAMAQTFANFIDEYMLSRE